MIICMSSLVGIDFERGTFSFDNFMNYMYATNDQWTIKIVLMFLYLKRSVKIRF